MIKIKKRIPKGEAPLWQYWQEFVECYLEEGKSEVTIKNVRDSLKTILRHTNIHTIEQCNNRNLLYKTLLGLKKERNWSNSNINTHRKNINTYFIWLESLEYIDVNKVSKVRKFKESNNEQYTLNDEQIQALLTCIHNRRQTRLIRWRNTLFLELMILTGARPCELMQLQYRDIKPESNGSYKITINGRKQKGRPRYYRLPSHIRDTYELYTHITQEIGRKEPNLFVSQSKRTGWTQKGMRKLFDRLSKELGFKVTAYSIRRYVATKLNSEGKDLNDIKNHLGHTRITTTQRYIEQSCFLTDKCTDVMSKVI